MIYALEHNFESTKDDGIHYFLNHINSPMFQLIAVKYGSESNQDNHFRSNFVLSATIHFLTSLTATTFSGVRSVSLLSELPLLTFKLGPTR